MDWSRGGPTPVTTEECQASYDADQARVWLWLAGWPVPAPIGGWTMEKMVSPAATTTPATATRWRTRERGDRPPTIEAPTEATTRAPGSQVGRGPVEVATTTRPATDPVNRGHAASGHRRHGMKGMAQARATRSQWLWVPMRPARHRHIAARDSGAPRSRDRATNRATMNRTAAPAG